MSRRVTLWCILGILVMACIPMPSYGQEGLSINLGNEKSCIEGEALPQNESGPKTMTLEELKELVGPQNVCGAQCGLGFPKCYFSCGDAAQCVWGYCVYS